MSINIQSIVKYLMYMYMMYVFGCLFCFLYCNTTLNCSSSFSIIVYQSASGPCAALERKDNTLILFKIASLYVVAFSFQCLWWNSNTNILLFTKAGTDSTKSYLIRNSSINPTAVIIVILLRQEQIGRQKQCQQDLKCIYNTTISIHHAKKVLSKKNLNSGFICVSVVLKTSTMAVKTRSSNRYWAQQSHRLAKGKNNTSLTPEKSQAKVC